MLVLRPMTLKGAREWVRSVHRHLPALVGGLWCVGVEANGALCGVAVVGRPARLLDDGWTAQVSRLATDGTFNACTKLYGACRRAARALGYRRLWTYTLAGEAGSSLHAAGFVDMGLTDGGEWDRPSRRRAAAVRSEPKRRWLMTLDRPAAGDPEGAGRLLPAQPALY